MTNKYIFLIQFDGGSFVENPSSIDIGGKSPLTLLPIRIALVLGRKRPRLRYRPKKHFRDFDPILAIGTRQERFCVHVSVSTPISFPECSMRTEGVTTLKRRRTLIDMRGKPLEQANGDIPVLKRERFAEVSTRLVDPDRVRPEMG